MALTLWPIYNVLASSIRSIEVHEKNHRLAQNPSPQMPSSISTDIITRRLARWLVFEGALTLATSSTPA